MIDLKRMWINQPSTLQPLHHLDGVEVLAIREDPAGRPDTYRIWFLSGSVVSMECPSACLSDGWY